jgi:hypothetical protein
MKMNRFLKGRAAPWAWMQTGPLTVDVEARLSNNDPEPERIPPNACTLVAGATPACTEVHTEAAARAECGALLPERAAGAAENEIVESAEPALPSEDAEPAVEDTKLTLDDFPALKAAMESFEKRGDPILISVDSEPSDVHTLEADGDLPEGAPKRRRSNAKPQRSRSKRIAKSVNLRPTAPRKPSRPKTQTEIDLSHHERRCTICHHPERDSIEEAFCQWRKVKFIAREFNATGGPTAIYRHARALNLFKQRNLTLRSSLEFVIEQSECVVPTAEGLVKAIRAYTRINDAGQWIDTPTTHIVQVMAIPAADARSLTNSVPGLTLNVRKHPSDIIESAAPQQLLTGSAPQTEIVVTD